MANIEIIIAEGNVAAVEKALCKRAGLEVSAANAKKAMAAEIKRWVVEEQRREAAITPPEIQ